MNTYIVAIPYTNENNVSDVSIDLVTSESAKDAARMVWGKSAPDSIIGKQLCHVMTRVVQMKGGKLCNCFRYLTKENS